MAVFLHRSRAICSFFIAKRWCRNKMKRTGYIGVIDGVKKAPKEKKSFRLLYDKEKPILYSYAKIAIGDKVFATDKAVWDTGVTITIAAHRMARELPADLAGTGTSISATDRSDSDIYLATLELPGGIVFENIRNLGTLKICLFL